MLAPCLPEDIEGILYYLKYWVNTACNDVMFVNRTMMDFQFRKATIIRKRFPFFSTYKIHNGRSIRNSLAYAAELCYKSNTGFRGYDYDRVSKR